MNVIYVKTRNFSGVILLVALVLVSCGAPPPEFVSRETMRQNFVQRFEGVHLDRCFWDEKGRLTEIDLYGWTLTRQDLEDIAADPLLDRVLLGETNIDDEGLGLLAGMHRLKILGLRETAITDAGLAQIAGLTNLEGLLLAETPVTDEGLRHLGGLTKLWALGLKGTRVTDAGLEHLKGLTGLRELYVTNTDVTEEAARQLEDALPELTVFLNQKS